MLEPFTNDLLDARRHAAARRYSLGMQTISQRRRPLAWTSKKISPKPLPPNHPPNPPKTNKTNKTNNRERNWRDAQTLRDFVGCRFVERRS